MTCTLTAMQGAPMAVTSLGLFLWELGIYGAAFSRGDGQLFGELEWTE